MDDDFIIVQDEEDHIIAQSHESIIDKSGSHEAGLSRYPIDISSSKSHKSSRKFNVQSNDHDDFSSVQHQRNVMHNPIVISSSKTLKSSRDIYDGINAKCVSSRVQDSRDENKDDYDDDHIFQDPSHVKLSKVPNQCNIVNKKRIRESDYGLKSLLTRVSPHALFGAVNSMTEEQKECINEIGFGNLIGIKAQSIPTKLSFYAVQAFDPQKMAIVTSNCCIPVTREAVNHVLGLPLGSQQIGCLPLRGTEDWFNDWKSQFKKPISTITPTDLVSLIIERSETDMVFVANFIILVCSTFGTCNKQGSCNLEVLPYLSKSTRLDQIDWCSYVLRLVKEEKIAWSKSGQSSYFNGPSAFLTLLYVDSTLCKNMRVQRNRPIINSWSVDLLKFREAKEIEMGEFGLCETSGPYVDRKNSFGLEDLEIQIKASIVELYSRVKKSILSYPRNNYFQKMEKILSTLCKTDFDKADLFFESWPSVDLSSSDDIGSRTNFHHSIDSELFIFSPNDSISSQMMAKRQSTKVCLDKNSDGSLNEYRDLDDFHTPKSLSMGSRLFVESHNTPHNLLKNDSFVGVGLSDRERRSMVDKIGSTGIVNEPSFDIGVDFDSNVATKSMYSEVQYVRNTNTSANIVGDGLYCLGREKTVQVNTVKEPFKDAQISNRSRRTQMLPPSLRSPYVERVVDMDTNLSQEHHILSNWVFSSSGDPMDTIFESKSGQRGERYMFESLCPNEHPFSGTIDCFAEVLNYDERFRNNDTPSCFFFKTCVTTPSYMDKEGYDDISDYENFKENVQHCLGPSTLIRSMRGYDVVFFPVCRNAHYFLYVFDLKNKRSVIIDNMEYEGIQHPYPNLTMNIVSMFGRYLEEVKHNMAHSVKYLITPQVQHITWKTKNNSNDCALFMMRHMETYKGGGIFTWKCGFKIEGAEQLDQIRKLRRLYCKKILLSDVNNVKKQVENQVSEYKKIPPPNRRQKYQESIRGMRRRLAAFGSG